MDFFDDIDTIIIDSFLPNIELYESNITPSYLLEPPYRNFLMAVARGDGKIFNIFKRAKLNETVGHDILLHLIDLGIIWIEKSREKPLKIYPKQKIKKNLRSYRIQPKVRFVATFFRFWFGFVEPYRDEIRRGEIEKFINNYRKHNDRLVSYNFEQLSNTLLQRHYAKFDPIISCSSFWDRYSEFDLLAITQSGKIVLGECKYRGRKICKNELNKLKEKAIHSGIRVDTFALFSKNGFSNELLSSQDTNLVLFDLEDFQKLRDG